MIKEHNFGKTKVFRLLSPDGQIFQGHRAALKFMIEEENPEEDVNEMRNCLKYYGWSTHEDLPENWLFKRSEKHKGEISFIDSSANYFMNAEAVLKSLLRDGHLKDLAILRHFCGASKDKKNEFKKSKELDNSWSQIQSLPSGWMITGSHFGLKKIYKLVSPEGHIFMSKIKALKFMVDEKYPSDQIEATRNLLKSDGWESNPKLPQDWLCKKQKNNATKILTSTGEIFRSREGVMNYMKCNDFEDIHIRNFKEFEICSNRTTKSPSSKSAHIRTQDDGWVSFDGEELSGWRHKPGQQKYLSPAGVYLNGRVELLKFMVNNNFSKEQVLAMKNVTKSIKN